MLLVRRGAADDPSGQEGLAAITADMLDEGTGAMSAIEIHEALARLGAQFDSDIGPDATLLTRHRPQPVHRRRRSRCSPTSSSARRSARTTSSASVSCGCTG